MPEAGKSEERRAMTISILLRTFTTRKDENGPHRKMVPHASVLKDDLLANG